MTSGTNGQRCHALRARLDPPVDPQAIARSLGPFARIWTQDLPVAHDDELAERRRQAELSRPVPAAPPGRDRGRGMRGSTGRPAARGQARAVLLSYADDVADLILTAHRADLDRRMLHALAGLAAGRPTSDLATVPAEVPAWQADLAVPPARCDWGLGDGRADNRVVCYRPAAPAALTTGDRAGWNDPAGWTAALALTLSRYDDTHEPVLGVAGQSGHVSLIRSPVCEALELSDLAAQARAELAGAPATPDHLPAGQWSGAGLLFATASPCYEYVPFLDPPFPLTLQVTVRDDGPARLECWYRPAIVTPEMAAQFTGHLLTARRQLLQCPRRRAGETDLLGPAGRRHVISLGRPARRPVQAAECIHQRFIARAGAQPAGIALSDATGRISYEQLDQCSSRIAQGLRALGIRRGDRVGICLDRSADLVAAILAVLKAGAVYVPMDPAYPVSRLTFMVEDSGATVVITALDDLPAARTVTICELAELSRTAGDSLPDSTAGPSDPAYIIYTSGSTGRPKGVVVPHGNVISLIEATQEDCALGASDTWTLFHSCAFDFSVWEMWGCLLTGGRLVIVPFWKSRAPDSFREMLITERVTVLSQTPSAFAQLIEADRGQPGELSVRLVVLGGETLSPRVLLPWLDRYPESRCTVLNMFGITETTVHVTAQVVTRKHVLGRSRSVGGPLPGWHVYVMDGRGRLAPPGVCGEIYVGGAGVAQYYLNRPDLTGQRFVADPFAYGAAGRRMYRSGDRGRLRPDGVLEHHGRLDDQVKLRGFRIEPAEVRAVLLEHPLVVDAAVVLHHDDRVGGAADRIDAYVVLADGSIEDVRQHAAGTLPAHMVPASVTALAALPLTPNGKLDATQLPCPRLGTVMTAGPGSADADAGPLAGCLAELWSGVLGTQVGLDDNFFDLGGNSLLAVRIAGSMRERGLPRLPLRDLYRHPTVRMLAELLGARDAQRQDGTGPDGQGRDGEWRDVSVGDGQRGPARAGGARRVSAAP